MIIPIETIAKLGTKDRGDTFCTSALKVCSGRVLKKYPRRFFESFSRFGRNTDEIFSKSSETSAQK